MKSKSAAKRKWLATFLKAILPLSLCALMTSCARYRIIPSDRAVLILKSGQALKVQHDGVYLPTSLYAEIQEALIECKTEKEQPR